MRCAASSTTQSAELHMDVHARLTAGTARTLSIYTSRRACLVQLYTLARARASQQQGTHELVAGGRRRLRDVPDDEVSVRRAAGEQVRAAGVELQALYMRRRNVGFLSCVLNLGSYVPRRRTKSANAAGSDTVKSIGNDQCTAAARSCTFRPASGKPCDRSARLEEQRSKATSVVDHASQNKP